MWPKSGNFRCHGCGKTGDQRVFLANIIKVPGESLEITDPQFYALCDTPGQMMLDLGCIYYGPFAPP